VVAEQPSLGLADLAGRLPAGELRLLVLDGVQDPGNVGTLLRSAAGLGASAVLTLPGTVDPWSAKVVRASMGALFRLPTVGDTAEAVAAFLAAQRIVLWGADGAGEPVGTLAAHAPDRLAVAVGNEGAGLSGAVRARAARLVAVPSSGLVESLNVAVAASILLYELRQSTLPAPARPHVRLPVTPAPAACSSRTGRSPSSPSSSGRRSGRS
jgi:TrmH family RNA methyltransferase